MAVAMILMKSILNIVSNFSIIIVELSSFHKP